MMGDVVFFLFVVFFVAASTLTVAFDVDTCTAGTSGKKLGSV
jgi:biopolymer transport protein ExbD